MEVIIVSEDGIGTVSRVRPYMEERKYTFKVLLDTHQEVSRLYKVRGMLTTIIIDKDGKICSRHVGYKAGDEKFLDKEVEKAILSEANELDLTTVAKEIVEKFIELNQRHNVTDSV